MTRVIPVIRLIMIFTSTHSQFSNTKERDCQMAAPPIV